MDESRKELNVVGKGQVPVFSLAIDVIKTSTGFSASVANLDMPSVEAANQRDAISRVCTAAKQQLKKSAGRGVTPTVSDPPSPKDGVERFLVPVHL
ncbi:MAG TPA: hypothetical protein DDW52_20960 [Planctomycetaceae bacterium]|nr:hypothetical protein [Planctomycetaceae bacterium]